MMTRSIPILTHGPGFPAIKVVAPDVCWLHANVTIAAIGHSGQWNTLHELHFAKRGAWVLDVEHSVREPRNDLQGLLHQTVALKAEGRLWAAVHVAMMGDRCE